MLLWLQVPFLALCAIAAHVPRDDGTLVTTAQGAVQGTLVTSTVRQWLGIPYAAPPTSTLRFQAPQAAPSRASTLSATSFGNSCPAVFPTTLLEIEGILQQQEDVPYAEDCLNLNVWAPATSRPQGGAVLIWVYGGGDMFGTSNTPFYNGQGFVENNDDLVLVSFNYRSNIFGFPNAPQQLVNVGLLDLEAAIQWVYTNIPAFGGDPERITIFGQSAGALAVDAYAFSHPSDTIVKGIIAESGTAQLTSVLSVGTTSPASTNSSWNTVATVVGCGITDNDAQLGCMQAVPWQTLLEAVTNSGKSFTPYPDGQTIFPDVSSRSSKGEFLKVPYLVGTNADEGDIFVLAYEAGGASIPVGATLLSDALTEVVFNCPASKSASDRTSAGVPTWRYRYEGVFPDLTDDNPSLRAYHTAEIALVFGTYALATDYPATATEIALSTYIQSAWVSFAHSPSSGPGWTRYTSETLQSTLAELGNSAHPSGATLSPPVEFDLGCGVVNALMPEILEVLGALGLGGTI
ncbi:carboxylesterase [Calocera viscosa TUFC12733]|uniref:Carboxylic ester hydrolase n=1 Tax=Calocera viscosa (strain TUFC12733) TaxID=1330018 RepID=A0A167K232_CALVF|nr:carboxylesterase [Calocera viscosa TUFC12733]